MAASFARYLGGKAVLGAYLLKAGCTYGLKVLGVGCIVGSAVGLTISSLMTSIASKVERKELFRQCPAQGYTRLTLLSVWSHVQVQLCTFFEYLGNMFGALLHLLDTLSQMPQRSEGKLQIILMHCSKHIINLFLMTFCCLAKVLSSYTRSKLRSLQGLPVRQSY